jgi:hypothetical protein
MEAVPFTGLRKRRFSKDLALNHGVESHRTENGLLISH